MGKQKQNQHTNDKNKPVDKILLGKAYRRFFLIFTYLNIPIYK